MATAIKHRSGSDPVLMKNWQETSHGYDYTGAFHQGYYVGVVDGEERGKRQQANIAQKAIQEAFLNNTIKVAHICQEFFADVKASFGTDIVNSFMKVESLSEFSVMFVLPLDFYYGEKRREYTEKLIQLEEKYNSEDFGIEFMSLPAKESLDEDALAGDGYLFKYDKTKDLEQA